MIGSAARLTVGLCAAAVFCWSGCGGGGGDDNDPVFPPEASAAAQQSVGMIQSTLSVLIGQRSEESSVMAVGSTCSAGSLDTSCEVENAISIVRGSFDHCRVPLSNGNAVTADGSLRLETGDRGVCVTGRIADTATVELRYGDYEQILADANGNELGRSRLDGTDRIAPTGVGCAGRDIDETFDGTNDQVVNYRAAGRLAADGLDARLRARDLQLAQTSAGAPCERMIIGSGEMDVDDRANGLRYTQTLNGLSIAYTEEDDHALVTLNGSVVNQCVGDLTVETVEPLRLHSATECPTGGVLRVTIDGRVNTTTFGPQGQLTIEAEDGGFLIIGSDCRGGVRECGR